MNLKLLIEMIDSINLNYLVKLINKKKEKQNKEKNGMKMEFSLVLILQKITERF